jgi:hypothetical protein
MGKPKHTRKNKQGSNHKNKGVRKNRYMPSQCTSNMSFNECELTVLRHIVDTNEKLMGSKVAGSDEIKGMIEIVEQFLIDKKLLCYGGTAINNILPKKSQFYNREIEIPDYDFFSSNALNDAKELTDIFYKAGYVDVEAKSGLHEGTYKVFVNFIPMADITSIHQELFDSLLKSSISVAGIKYVPADFLRMSMYLELSRPNGDISRWEKVLKRLNLLNEAHPMSVSGDCSAIEIQRKMDNDTESDKLYTIIRDTFIDNGVVFFGGYAASLYSINMSKTKYKLAKKIPDFDVLSEDIEKTALIVTERLNDANFKNITQIHHKAVGEIIPEHISIRYNDDEILAFIYKPMACHNYNTIKIQNVDINIATIDTIMSFYLAFLYADVDYYLKDRILCTAQYLFKSEQTNKLAQRGVFQRFVPKCMGYQETMENIRAKKSSKFDELRKDRGGKEWEKYFLKYAPGENASETTSDKKSIKNTSDSISNEDEDKGESNNTENNKYNGKDNSTKKKRKSPMFKLNKILSIF